MYFPIEYNEPLFRPPGEANSVIFQISLGCSWNKCAFCEMYKMKKFTIRKMEEIKEDINKMAAAIPMAKKFFLADGDALALPTESLIEILNYIKSSFKRVQRISSYASPKNILSKSNKELQLLKKNGLSLFYLGIESGNDEILQAVNKGENSDKIAQALLKAHKENIDTSVMIISGLGGKEYSKKHAIDSAAIVNKTQPKFLSLLTLMLPKGAAHYQKHFKGNFIELNAKEILDEIKLFIEHTDLENTIFRSDHSSNMIPLKGVLGKNKERLLMEIS